MHVGLLDTLANIYNAIQQYSYHTLTRVLRPLLLLYTHLKYKEIIQKVLTFKCSGTIGGSTQKELVMAPLPRKKHFKTVTLLFGEHFPVKVKSVSRGVNNSDDVTLYGTLQLIIFSPVST